jgi:hypothetical protein
MDTSSISDVCSPRVIITSQEACPVLSLGTLWTFFNRYYFLFGTFMMFLGSFLMVFGGRYYQFTMFVSGQMTVAAIIMIIMFVGVYPTNSPMWVVWMTLIVSLLIGCGAGYGTQKWARVGVLLIGAWIGGLLGGVVYSLFVNVFVEDNPMLALWLTILFCSIIVAIVS